MPPPGDPPHDSADDPADDPADVPPGGLAGARRRGWGLVRVTGRSMEPTLVTGDRLLVRWGVRDVAPGRLVVVRLPGGRPVSVKRLLRRLPEGWWVERDNPAAGVDSWTAGVGALPAEDLLGVVLARVWPWRRRIARG